MKTLTLEDFPLRTFEKLRYSDTDRQGHVNNAVFVTMLETGRVELLLDPEAPLAAAGCAFVLASLKVDYLAEIRWPGRVEIGTRVAALGRSSITIEQALYQNEICVATSTSVVVQMNESTRRSQPLDEAATLRVRSLLPSSGD